MADNLYAMFCETAGQKSYYGIDINPDELFDPVNSTACCRKLIGDHFERGSKGEALDFPPDWKMKYDESEKHVHTVSLYLLGISLQNLFSDIIKKDLLRRIANLNEWYDYKYTWYLACLFHDAASEIENEWDLDTDCSLSDTLSRLEVDYTPFGYVPIKLNAKLTRFSESIVKKYFQYLKESDEKHRHAEHGTIGGYMLFDRLYKNFENRTRNVTFDSNGCYIDEKMLSWRKEHIDHFAYISDAIICHNIWTVTSAYPEGAEILSEYQTHELGDLILPFPTKEDDKRLDFYEYPLQFMLCLLDTIEPVKRFREGGADAQFVLKHIAIREVSNKNAIRIKWSKCIRDKWPTEFLKWKRNILDLEKWMKVRAVLVPSKTSIEVLLPY